MRFALFNMPTLPTALRFMRQLGSLVGPAHLLVAIECRRVAAALLAKGGGVMPLDAALFADTLLADETGFHRRDPDHICAAVHA